MFVVIVDEIAFDVLEGLVHAFQNQVVPVWRKTQKLAETRWLVLYQHDGNTWVKQAVLTSKFYDPSLWLIHWPTAHNPVVHEARGTQIKVGLVLTVLRLLVLFNDFFDFALFVTLLLLLKL